MGADETTPARPSAAGPDSARCRSACSHCQRPPGATAATVRRPTGSGARGQPRHKNTRASAGSPRPPIRSVRSRSAPCVRLPAARADSLSADPADTSQPPQTWSLSPQLPKTGTGLQPVSSFRAAGERSYSWEPISGGGLCRFGPHSMPLIWRLCAAAVVPGDPNELRLNRAATTAAIQRPCGGRRLVGSGANRIPWKLPRSGGSSSPRDRRHRPTRFQYTGTGAPTVRQVQYNLPLVVMIVTAETPASARMIKVASLADRVAMPQPQRSDHTRNLVSLVTPHGSSSA